MDELQVAVDAPAQLRLMEAGPDRQHDIGLAPQFMAGQRRLGEVMTVADDALAAGEARDRGLQHLGDGQHFLAGIDGAAADEDQRFFG